MDVGSVFTAAFLRAFMTSILLGLSAGLTALQMGQDDRNAVIAGVSAAVSAFLIRGFGEGGFDANRARTGNVLKSDIGSTTTTVTTSTPIASGPVVITQDPATPGT